MDLSAEMFRVDANNAYNDLAINISAFRYFWMGERTFSKGSQTAWVPSNKGLYHKFYNAVFTDIGALYKSHQISPQFIYADNGENQLTRAALGPPANLRCLGGGVYPPPHAWQTSELIGGARSARRRSKAFHKGDSNAIWKFSLQGQMLGQDQVRYQSCLVLPYRLPRWEQRQLEVQTPRECYWRDGEDAMQISD